MIAVYAAAANHQSHWVGEDSRERSIGSACSSSNYFKMAFVEQSFSKGSLQRFSLLLLEPGEIYFDDYSVWYFPDTATEDEAMHLYVAPLALLGSHSAHSGQSPQ